MALRTKSKKAQGRRAKRVDQVATAVISAGGLLVILSVVLILLLIVSEALPLFASAKAPLRLAATPARAPEAPAIVALALDEYVAEVALVDAAGRVVFRNTRDGAVTRESRLEPPGAPDAHIVFVEESASGRFNFLWSDGYLTLASLATSQTSDANGDRVIDNAFEARATVAPTEQAPARMAIARAGEDGVTRVDLFDASRLVATRTTVEEDLFGNTEEKTFTAPLTHDAPGDITAMTLDEAGEFLYAGTSAGRLLRWDLRDPEAPELTDAVSATEDGGAITALAFVLGDISIAVGDASGHLTTWFSARAEEADTTRTLVRAHTLAQHDGAVAHILPSRRNKTLFTLSDSGALQAHHVTAERHLFDIAAERPLRAFAVAPRMNGLAALDDAGDLRVWDVDSPHPEVNFATLFLPIWYEDYSEPEYVWQSSASSDDFEPKLSLMPLLFGSLKGTLYAMFFALPLAVFAAIYTSQFVSPRARGHIKTSVELMAAVPSVVIGFLIALWLAPIVERHIVAFLVAPLVTVAVFFAFLGVWPFVRTWPFLRYLEQGHEFILLVPVVVLACLLAYGGGMAIEETAFGGDFRQWIFEHLGRTYDQRNCIIIAFGLGFAVIPIIFTISEDALGNIPGSLKAASLALGANRWQTAWRVVLPAASPGIFAGAMIGFGRAVGETMIVLMATGNTPLMDWSPFNGMRTLSANIAVEIPEAPIDSTLYRVLFLSAVILFLLTSCVNTSAELVRQYLRKKYGQFQ